MNGGTLYFMYSSEVGETNIWTSMAENDYNAGRIVYTVDYNFTKQVYPKGFGLSVRCVRHGVATRPCSY